MNQEEAKHEPTRATRMEVCQMVYANWDLKMIATDLKISTSCLKKHYRAELKDGIELLKKYVKMLYVQSAIEKKSVSQLRAIAEEGQPAADASSVVDGAPKTPEKKGKKEQRVDAAKDATKAGSLYQTPLPPGRGMNGAH